MYRLLLLFLGVFTFAQQNVQDTVQLADMVFSPEDKNRSLEILTRVGENIKKNYLFHQKVNYPLTIQYDGKDCSESYSGEIAFNTLLNSSIKFDNLDKKKCIIKQFKGGDAFTLIMLSNIKFLDNWGGMFSKKRIENAKYGSLKQFNDEYIITFLRDNMDSSIMEVNKTNYALTAMEGSIKLKDDSPMSGYNLEIKYDYYGAKYHPSMILVNFEDGRKITYDFGKNKPYRKLQKDKNGMGLFKFFKTYNKD